MIHQSCLLQDGKVPPAANDTSQRAAGLATLCGSGHSCFDIYRTEEVQFTSTLFGGGDWHWRLTGPSGDVLADCGGYQNHRDCLATVNALRTVAGSAIVSTPCAPYRF